MNTLKALVICLAVTAPTAFGYENGPPQIEIKVPIKADSIPEALGKLLPLGADFRAEQIYFFDTPDLTLLKQGLILRARQKEGGSADLTFKARSRESSQVDEIFQSRRLLHHEVEVNLKGSNEAYSLTLRRAERQIAEYFSGETPIKEIFYFAIRELTPCQKQKIPWKEVQLRGQAAALMWTIPWTFHPHALPGPPATASTDPPLDGELWVLPLGGLILEISVKSSTEVGAPALPDVLEAIAALGISPDPNPRSKTEVVLEGH